MAAACAPLVHPATAHAVVLVESGFNPHAIGVVGAQLERQPRTRGEAIATARALRTEGRNFSVGLAQINRHNFDRLGLTLETALDPCANLAAMQTLLVDCFARARAPHKDAQQSLRKALSCYFSGNFTTGIAHGYTRRVVRAALASPIHPAKNAT